jgi:hypothetical protein
VSRPVTLADVVPHIADLGDLAILVTVTADGAPHVGTVLVSVGTSGLEVRVGPRTRDHICANPSVSLTWLRDDVTYQLIVDGVAVVADDPGTDGLYPVGIDVHGGILHRVAGRSDGPSCRSLAHVRTS